MKISAVQLQSVTGNIASNLAKHLEFSEVAIDRGADLVFFPELSLMGHEPKLARSLATDKTDSCLNVFQQCSDAHNVIIGVSLRWTVGCLEQSR
ncbi:MAG: nitrilase-related carbon-nitrogen hydrolase [Cyanophyceae cyanobacterium]